MISKMYKKWLSRIIFLGLIILTMGFSFKVSWDPVIEAYGYRIFVRLEGQVYDYTKPIWDSSLHGTKEKVELASLSETIDPNLQAFPLPGQYGDEVFLVCRAFNPPADDCPDGVESDDSNEVSCFNNGEKCTKVFVFPPQNLTVEIN